MSNSTNSRDMNCCPGNTVEPAEPIAQHPDWMGSLPVEKQTIPLLNLVIPGSHNSFSNKLYRDRGLGNDLPDWLRKLDNPFTRNVVYNWSRCQSLPIAEQLNAGIRYLDIRVSAPDSSLNQFRIIHGLYGDDVAEVLVEVLEFLGSHPKEVVLLDFNHFYNFGQRHYSHLANIISSLFDSKLCPMSPPTSVSLKFCWDHGYQALVFYQPPDEVPIPQFLWDKSSISSPWANTDDPDVLFQFLKKALIDKGKTHLSFYVTQGIGTPKTRDILKHAFGTLEKDLAAPISKRLVAWLREDRALLAPLLNIVICDFVQIDSFPDTVIKFNV